MPINAAIPMSYQAPEIDVNAMLQQRAGGMENIYQIETARQAQAAEAAKEQQAAIAQMMLPSVAAAFSDPSDAGLEAATSLMPPEAAETFAPFMDRLRGVPDVKLRQALLRAELMKDDEGRLILGQLEPTANMRLQADTAAQAQALKMRELQLREEEFAASGNVSPDVAARLEFEREKLAAEQAAKAAVVSGEAPPVDLQKGERWNPETQRVEAVPGSTTYNKQKSVQATDYGAATNALRELNKVRGVVSELKNTTGYQKAMGTGAIMSNLPNTPASSITGAYDFQTKYKNLKGSVATLGRAAASLQGKLGNMAVQEWKLVSDAIANLDLESMDADVLDAQLDIIANDIIALEAQVRNAYENEWGETQFYRPLGERGAAGGAESAGDDPLGIR